MGITDYFSLDSFFEFKKHYESFYPGFIDKAFFPNLELRLPEVLNDAGQSVNIHLLFRPDLSASDARKFLMALQTETTVGKAKKPVFCAELKSANEFESATVSRASIEHAIKQTFGERAIFQDNVLIVTSAKGDGIRPGNKSKGSKKRKNNLSDETDKMSHAFFAGPASRDYFLSTDRLESDEQVTPKPVFGGCDAHSFDTLRSGLGKQSDAEGQRQNITWIKADLTYEGLLQTLIEPAQRVVMQTNEPDFKEPYKYISRVKFSNTADFPTEIVFNRNLNSIIGSRSSGKSALLAFIAHAVDPEDTIQQQIDVSNGDRNMVGPAAGKSWVDVSDVVCSVEWGSAEVTSGKVIYIPQNSLYVISEHPDKVTQKIVPSLFRHYPNFKTDYDQALTKVRAANVDIRAGIVMWFELAAAVDGLSASIRDLGDKNAIMTERDNLQAKIDQIKKESELSDEEIASYLIIAGELDERHTRLTEIDEEVRLLSQYTVKTGDDEASVMPGSVVVSVRVEPSGDQLPDVVAAKVEYQRRRSKDALNASVEKELTEALITTLGVLTKLNSEIERITRDNAELIAKHTANAELEKLSEAHKKQVKALGEIDKKESSRTKKEKAQSDEAAKIAKSLNTRSEAFVQLKSTFTKERRVLEDLVFGVEAQVDPDTVTSLSLAFNKNEITDYVQKVGQPLDYVKAQDDPGSFLAAIRSGTQKLNKGYAVVDTVVNVLATAPEVRFTAELDEDKIGGFGRSSMTPGKQALFALTLLLNESQEPWPLLIDQPEDDLDSRSIYNTVVPYLVERKRERQIIMVSHNANLVIGADSEEVIVANRNGADRPNRDARTFEYLTGSLEHSQPKNEKSKTTLGRYGIREHACEILDGGEEAFQKRKEKYKI
nr:hypothetical protein [Acidithrix ferrooxidans]